MSTENCAPVTLADGLAIVGQLRDLHERAELNAQTMFAFVFQVSADSLSDNLSTADEMSAADADG